MSIFSESAFVKRLVDLNGSQQSIQTLSQWLVFHRKNAKTIVQVWQTQLIQTKTKKKLVFLYLANDVIQHSRKKGPEFIRAFGGVLITAFTHVAKHSDDKTFASVNRMLKIWNERKIYESKYILSIQKAVMNISQSKSGKKTVPIKRETADEKPTLQKIKVASSLKRKHKKTENVKKEPSETESPPKSIRLQELIGQNEEDDYLTMSPHDPPAPEELVKALKDLENCASTDEEIRSLIYKLPQPLQDFAGAEKIQNKREADDLLKTIGDASKMLIDYNSRLDIELTDRRRVGRMLADFIKKHQVDMVETEKEFERVTQKLQDFEEWGKKLENHIENLPDFSKLARITQGLDPLPSAGDLFN